MSLINLETEQERIDLNLLKKKTVNLAVFGHGNVGGHLLDQIVHARETIAARKNIVLNVFAVVNSKQAKLVSYGIDQNWRNAEDTIIAPWELKDVIDFANSNSLANLIAVDNTASREFVAYYPQLIAAGFNLVSSNKIGNTLNLEFYRQIRNLLDNHGREYLYETNVGAGLPLIDTIKLLHLSGENITRIRGVFSGSLSYIFNSFSQENKLFSEVVKEAASLGLTEPDPREDLSGADVGRKLLILARELDLYNEYDDVEIENLVPEELRNGSAGSFLKELKALDEVFQNRKDELPEDHVLRYVADLHGDLSSHSGAKLNVCLKTVAPGDSLAQITGSDSVFELYTENYCDRPIVIKGAGAGGIVTARGVFGDILRLSEKL